MGFAVSSKPLRYMLPGFCRANKTIRNFLACKCRMLPPRWSRQSLRTVLWMGCKNFIMLPSLLIAIQHYNMMNVAGKDYCNRFDIKKSEFFVWRTLKIDTMSWISVSKKADTDKNFSPTVSKCLSRTHFPRQFSSASSVPCALFRLLGMVIHITLSSVNK